MHTVDTLGIVALRIIIKAQHVGVLRDIPIR